MLLIDSFWHERITKVFYLNDLVVDDVRRFRAVSKLQKDFEERWESYGEGGLKDFVVDYICCFGSPC